jgi:hypothetical protein
MELVDDDDTDNGLIWTAADDEVVAEPAARVERSLHDLRNSLASSSDVVLRDGDVVDDDNDDDDDAAAAAAASVEAALRLARAKLAQLRAEHKVSAAPAPASLASAAPRADSLLSEFVLCIDVGSFQTKVGLAVADPLLAADVSLSPFVAVTCEATRDLFRDAGGLAARLEALVLSLLPAPRAGARPHGSLRDVEHVMLAFPGFYYHRSAAMRFARLFGAWSSDWARRFSGAELARVLGVDAGRLTFMNSRTASGWAFIERFGCAAHAGLVLTLGANAGVFGVWRGLMFFTRPRRQEDRPLVGATAGEDEVAKAVFDGGSVIANKATGESVRSLLRYSGERAPTTAALAMATSAACETLLAFGSKLSKRLKTSKPALLIVHIAGGGANDDAVRNAQPAIAHALRERFGAQVAIQVELADDPLFNDLRGLLYFHRSMVARGGIATAQRNVDQPTALLVEAQVRAQDLLTSMLALTRTSNAKRDTALLDFERWLVCHRLGAVSLRQPDVRAAFPPLRALIEDDDFMRLLSEKPDGLFLLGKLAADHDGGASELCAWIASNWCEFVLALLSCRAVPALKLLTDLLLETPSASASLSGSGGQTRVVGSVHVAGLVRDSVSNRVVSTEERDAAVNTQLRSAGAPPLTKAESKLVNAAASPAPRQSRVPPPLPPKIASVVAPVAVAHNVRVSGGHAAAVALALQQRRKAIAISKALTNDAWEEGAEDN